MEIIVRMKSDHIKVKDGEYVQDLIRCKDCIYKKGRIGMVWSKFGTSETSADGWCYMAKGARNEQVD